MRGKGPIHITHDDEGQRTNTYHPWWWWGAKDQYQILFYRLYGMYCIVFKDKKQRNTFIDSLPQLSYTDWLLLRGNSFMSESLRASQNVKQNSWWHGSFLLSCLLVWSETKMPNLRCWYRKWPRHNRIFVATPMECEGEGGEGGGVELFILPISTGQRRMCPTV